MSPRDHTAAVPARRLLATCAIALAAGCVAVVVASQPGMLHGGLMSVTAVLHGANGAELEAGSEPAASIREAGTPVAVRPAATMAATRSRPPTAAASPLLPRPPCPMDGSLPTVGAWVGPRDRPFATPLAWEEPDVGCGYAVNGLADFTRAFAGRTLLFPGDSNTRTLVWDWLAHVYGCGRMRRHIGLADLSDAWHMPHVDEPGSFQARAANETCSYLSAHSRIKWVDSEFVVHAPGATGPADWPAPVTLRTKWVSFLDEIVATDWWARLANGTDDADAVILGQYHWYSYGVARMPSRTVREYVDATRDFIRNISGIAAVVDAGGSGISAARAAYLRRRIWYRTPPIIEQLPGSACCPLASTPMSLAMLSETMPLWAAAGYRVVNMTHYSRARACDVYGYGGWCSNTTLTHDKIHPYPYVSMRLMRALLSRVAADVAAEGGWGAVHGIDGGGAMPLRLGI